MNRLTPQNIIFKDNWLILSKYIFAFNMRIIRNMYIPSVVKKQVFLMLEQVVHIGTTVFGRASTAY
jgi:hypothetical protein